MTNGNSKPVRSSLSGGLPDAPHGFLKRKTWGASGSSPLSAILRMVTVWLSNQMVKKKKKSKGYNESLV